ncbi:MAG: transglycosylase domain-containing protein [Sporichthyaceae bacterium]
MNPFRRGRSKPDPTSSPGPSAADDQWFRPEPAPGRGAGTGAKPAADAPTESFTPPANWLDKKPAAAKAVAGSGVGGGKGAGGGSGGGSGSGPGRGGKGAAGGPTGPGGKNGKNKRKKKHRLQKVLWSVLAIFAIGFFMALAAYSRIEIPDPNLSATQQTSRVFYAGGEEEIGRFGDVNRVSVPLDRVPTSLRDAVLAVENRNFYTDNGVSPKGMLRALWVNLRGGSTQGGSTITQQYVKNYYLTTERSIQRKLKEALLSIKIDRDRSKDQILEDYLNTIYLGRGAYGVQAAAKAFFNKNVEDLSVSEGAVLAGVIQRPSRYDATDAESRAALRARWQIVINSMVETGALTPEARDKLKYPKFPKRAQAESRFGGQKGYILTMIREELKARGLSTDDIENGGLRIVTTLDPQAQEAAENAVPAEFPKTSDKKLNKNLRVGLVAIEPGTGKVRAMYGGEDFLGKGKFAQVNAATYPIQAGSTMKVFTTEALLENGYTLESRFDGNSPLALPGSKPVRNQFDRSFGSVTLKRALMNSINTAFVDATTRVGADAVRRAMVRAGIPNKTPGLDTNARITLGIASTPASDVAGAIGTICGGGIRAETHIVDRVIGSNGGEIPIRKPERSDESVFSPEAIAGTLEAMQAVVGGGTGAAAKRLGRPAAGKTGNHEGLTVWFSGCTPQLATSVNYFFGNGTKDLPLVNGRAFAGGTFPTETWTTFMKDALRGQPVQEFPKAQRVASTETPTKDPFDTESGFNGENPDENGPLVTTGPIFPSFDPGPSVVPSPKPEPEPKPEPSPTATVPATSTPDPTDSNTPTASPTVGQQDAPTRPVPQAVSPSRTAPPSPG